jgi:hypothetical protein
MTPRLKSLVLVSDSAKISRPRKRIDALDEVIKAEQLKTRLFDAFDALPDWDLIRLIGKEGLDKFARGVAALHQPASFDWAAKFGLAAVPESQRTLNSDPRAAPGADRQPRPWLVKYDGPCARCGRVLAKGTPGIWDQSARKMRCIDCLM